MTLPHALVVLTALGTMAACASPAAETWTKVTWTKAGVTRDEFERDTQQCRIAAQEILPSRRGPRTSRYDDCMEALGYTPAEAR
jgi:hypothetical protein